MSHPPKPPVLRRTPRTLGRSLTEAAPFLLIYTPSEPTYPGHPADHDGRADGDDVRANIAP
jgi:hypothetical protein